MGLLFWIFCLLKHRIKVVLSRDVFFMIKKTCFLNVLKQIQAWVGAGPGFVWFGRQVGS